MAKAGMWTLSLAPVVAMTMASLTVPAMAQARLDPSTASAAPATVPGSSLQVAAPRQIAAPLPSSSTASAPRAGSLQGFGPMQANPLLGTQPLQDGSGKW
jgi:hypothetical protein